MDAQLRIQSTRLVQRAITPAHVILFITFASFALPFGLSYQLLYIISVVGCTAWLLAVGRVNGIGLASLVLLWSAIAVATEARTTETSWYQIGRAGIPFCFLLTVLHVSPAHLSAPPKQHFIKCCTLFAATQVAVIIGSHFGMPYGNVTIIQDSAGNDPNRYFAYPVFAEFVLVWIGLRERRLVLTCAASAVILATGSKALLASLAWIIFLALSLDKRGSARGLRIAVALLAIALLGLLITIVAPHILIRFTSALDEGDAVRLFEIQHGLNTWLATPISFAIGQGFGVSVSDGFFNLNSAFNPDQAGAFENCKYDIHNGHIGLLAKTGLIGTCVVWYLIWRWTRWTGVSLALIPCIIINLGSASSFITTFDGVLAIMAATVYASTIGKNQTILHGHH